MKILALSKLMLAREIIRSHFCPYSFNNEQLPHFHNLFQANWECILKPKKLQIKEDMGILNFDESQPIVRLTIILLNY